MPKLELTKFKSTKFLIPYDLLGPEKVIVVKEPSLNLLGFLVIDNTACMHAPGPGKGGLRVAPNVTVDEVFRLARIMTCMHSRKDLSPS
jgi:glutamate dehydrogenase (NAD(P)+)